MTNFKNAPHGFIPEKFQSWYSSNCGYYYDGQREKEGYYSWVVDGSDIVNDIVQEQDGKNSKKGDLVEGIRAVGFDQKYARAKRLISDTYNDKNLTSNENIFLTMQGKTIKIKGKDEFEG